MKVFQWNLEGFNSVFKEGVAQVDTADIDVMILNETFLTENVNIPGYTVYDIKATRKSSRGRPSGGILTAVRSSLGIQILDGEENVLHVKIPSLDTSFLNCYFPPDTAVDVIVDQLISSLADQNTGSIVVIAGDANCRIDKESRGEELTEELEDVGMHLMTKNNEPTYVAHNGSSVIDLVYTNQPGRLIRSALKEEWPRKHRQVTSVWKLRSGNCGQKPMRKKREIDMSAIPRCVYENVERMLKEDKLNQAVEYINGCILKAAPDATINTVYGRAVWFDKECRLLKRTCIQQMRAGDGRYTETKKEFSRLKKRKKQEYNENRTVARILEAGKTPFALFRKKPGSGCPITASELRAHFEELLAVPTDDIGEDYDEGDVQIFTEEEVKRVFMHLARRKAPGIDQVTNEHLMMSYEALKWSWNLIFGYCLSKARIPDLWRKSLLFLLYKGKGGNHNPNSYRGISLLNTSFKVFTKLVKNRLEELCESKLSDCQFGFRKGRSAMDAIQRLMVTTSKAQEDSVPLYVLFVDYQKAFDSVDRALLMNKLRQRYAVDDGHLKVISQLLKTNGVLLMNQMCQCRQFHGDPDEIGQTVGVPQGDSLSPYLFALFIDDLVDYLKSKCSDIELILYADDVALMTRDKRILKKALLWISEWSSENKLKVNAAKTKVMKFRRGGRFANDDIFDYEQTRLEIVSEFTYLGVTLQPGLVFTKHVARVKRKASAAMAVMYGEVKKISIKSALNIFQAKVLPIASYALHLIAPYLKAGHLESLDVIKNRYLKKALSLPMWTGNEFIYRLCEEKRLCMDLKEKGYEFGQAQYNDYLNLVDGSKQREQECQRNEVPGGDEAWRGILKTRHFPLGYSAHGFHHRICNNSVFHRGTIKTCRCKRCGERQIGVNHLETCVALTGSLFERYTFVCGD